MESEQRWPKEFVSVTSSPDRSSAMLYRRSSEAAAKSHEIVFHADACSVDNRIVIAEPSPVVLVVEDDTAVRQPLVKFLQMRQYTVVTAETADEGVDAIRDHRPAAAIVDLRLRRGSGREVVVSMPPHVPVIIFSGLRSESANLESLRPRTRLVEKPYSLLMLMDTLEDMLEQAKDGR
jgi:CheY-like chemotaxis protein